jgi:predicted nucleic acid-binding protein
MTGRARALLDTNVLVYAAAGDNPAKQATALDLLDREGVGLCAQVLHEFYDVVTRKLKRPLAPQAAMQWLDELDAYPRVELDLDTVRDGAELSHRYGIRYWDGAVLAAAHRFGAAVMFSEDLNDGQTYGSVRVENPFKDL